mgnify:FL=1
MKQIAIGLVVGLGLIATAIYLKPSPSSTEYAKICDIPVVYYDPDKTNPSKTEFYNLKGAGISKATAYNLLQYYKDGWTPIPPDGEDAKLKAEGIIRLNRQLRLMSLGNSCKEGDVITPHVKPNEVAFWVQKQCSFNHQILIHKHLKYYNKVQCIYNGVNWDDQFDLSKRSGFQD